MLTSKSIRCALIILATTGTVVNGNLHENSTAINGNLEPKSAGLRGAPIATKRQLQDCQTKFGPFPITSTCDNFSSLGSNAYLDNKAADHLNTNVDVETAAATATRLTGQMPLDPENIQPLYNPVFDAYCFNEDYPVPSLSSAQQHSLYLDYKVEFDKINEFTTDVSIENNKVTNNRIPGMFLRMCFHDNSVDPTEPDFQHYVASAIDPNTKKWKAEARYMKTSGADASVLICPEERYHPNQNYDQTASRVLRSIQTSLKKKYPHMSYADLMHNGCNAATVYLAQQDPSTSLSTNPFTFGRKDACHVDKKCSTKYPLCGPTELLPGVELSANAVTHWFTSRGMSECLFMGLMWTHTTVDNMASMCPLKRLTCTASSSDVDAFTDKAKLYFNAGDNLDYFNFFLKRGTTQTLPVSNVEGAPTCNWVVDGRQVPWPMTGIDCTLGLASVEKSGPVALANVIKNFGHNSQYNRVDILQCALKVLGGAGGAEGGSCDKVIPTECKSNPHHKFGGYYSTSTQTSNVRVTVDPSCQQHYVVAPTPTSRTKSTWWCYDGTNNQGAVTITWGHTEGDAAWACNNWNQWCKSSRRCTAGTSWNCKQGDGKWIGNVDIWWGNTQGDATWACNTWQPNCRSSCRAEWKSIF